MILKSIRWRLQIWYGLVFLAVLTGFGLTAYELERKQWRPLVVALKDRRRVRVGDHLTFLFENRETVRYQIQEMLRIERIVETAAIRHELDTYNEQIPAEGELSATLLIEYESTVAAEEDAIV